jgi:hypothetical protein
MNSRNLKKFIIPILLAIILLLVLFTSSKSRRAGGGSLPLGLGQTIRGTNKFTNISRFGRTLRRVSRFGADDETPVEEQTGNPDDSGSSEANPTTYPGSGKPITILVPPADFIPGPVKLTSDEMIEGAILSDSFGKYAQVAYPPNGHAPASVNNILASKSQSDTQTKIRALDNKDKTALGYNVLAVTVMCGSKLRPMIDYCLKNQTESGCKKMDVLAWATNELLNTDIINNVPKVGAGWDEYTIQSAKVTKDIQLVVTPSVNTGGKPIKSIYLRYRGKEKGTPPSTIEVSLTGKDKSGNPLGKYEYLTSFFEDPEYFHYAVRVLLLDYPVTVDSASIKLKCPGTEAAVDDALILFVYQ